MGEKKNELFWILEQKKDGAICVAFLMADHRISINEWGDRYSTFSFDKIQQL